MRILITGAGRVGMAAANVASRNGSVLIMERNPETADTAQNLQGVSVLRNDASNPKNLKSAIGRFKPDVIITAIDNDGLNIFIDVMAKHFSPEIRTIATIRDFEFNIDDPIPGVDAVIAPRDITAKRIAGCVLLENSTSVDICRKDTYVATFRIYKGSRLSGKYAMNINLKAGTILAIYRCGQVITSVFSEQFHDEDRVLIIGTYDTIAGFNDIVGVEHKVRNITIIGAGKLGIAVAGMLLKAPGRHVIKVLDSDLDRCNSAAHALRGAVVVNGQIGDPVFLRSENTDRADVVVAVPETDEENLLVCMNAVRFEVKKIVSQYTTEEYGDLLMYSGIECSVGYQNVITNETTANIALAHDGADSSYALDNPGESLLYLTVDENLPLLNRPVGDLYLPEGTRLVAITRDGSTFFPLLQERPRVGDELVFYTARYNSMEFSRILGRPFTGI